MTVRYDEKSNTVSLTVRALTDFLCRGGDIGGGRGVSAEDGKLTHKRVADGSGDGFMIEVPLEYEYAYNGIKYRLSGRADGICPGDGVTADIIEEVKTVPTYFYGGADRIPAAHIAQGVLYAFMWCQRERRDRATVRITYAPKGDGRERSFECPLSFAELRTQAEELFYRYARWAELNIERARNCAAEIGALRFPYADVRDGQRDFMAGVVRAARLGRRALIEAPTGIGKTMASLYPSVKSLGAGYVDRIFYLTQKSSTAESAESAMKILNKSLPSQRSISILARDRICPVGGRLYPGGSCTPELCPRAAGHYDRVLGALGELIFKVGRGHHITSGDVAAVAEKYNVCPYELSLDAAEMCDVIVCDCNYVFDPKVYFRRFFDTDDENEHKTEKYMYLCDEAHNLVDRACGMYSSSIRLSTVSRLLTLLDGVDGEIVDALAAVRDEILKMKTLAAETLTEDANGNASGYVIESAPFASLCRTAKDASELCGKLLRAARRDGAETDEARRNLAVLSEGYTELSDFADSAEHFDKRHVAFAEISGGDIKCSHLCLDASAHIAKSLSRAKSAVFFSATLQPHDYFRRVLGIEQNCDTLELPSPYDERNLCVLAADKISTRLSDREASAPEIASMVHTVITAKTGNYICYLPSYKYLRLISDAFSAMYGGDDVEIIDQSRSMTERERERFLQRFTPNPDRSRIGFCVLGGLFSEGVDLPGDRLSGAIVVGVGLPQISSELNLRSEHFERICERGVEFAYMFPGMNKVLQASGRVIRGEDDRGVVLLIDDRFGTKDYRALFPDHWKTMRYIGDNRSLASVLSDFWSG